MPNFLSKSEIKISNEFEKKGFIINWKELEKQSLDETINALAMASPFSLEEKQVLLEAKDLNVRKNKIFYPPFYVTVIHLIPSSLKNLLPITFKNFVKKLLDGIK